MEKLAWHAAMSRRNFTRVFADQLGTSPAQYVEQLGGEAARCLLEETEQGVEEIAAACGFSSAELMRRAFLRSIEAAEPIPRTFPFGGEFSSPVANSGRS